MDERFELSTLKRGLRVLRLLSEEGPMSLVSMVRHLGLPRTNIHRLVQTLIAEGYCYRLPNSRLYGLTAEVVRLAAGFCEDDRLVTVATPLLQRFCAETKLPVALSTREGTRMRVRIATDHQSPFALIHVRPGYSPSICQTTTGLLCLALASSDVQEQLLQIMRARDEIRPHFQNEAELHATLRCARAQHYLILDERFAEASLGVPLMVDGACIGGIVLRYIKTAISRTQAVTEYLPRLRLLGDDIARAFGAVGCRPGPRQAAE